MNFPDEHRWAAQALPWQVNGTISAADAARLELHLHDCEQCRRDLETEQALARRLAAGAVVDYAPQVGLSRMLQRLDGAPSYAPTRPEWWGRLRRRARGRDGHSTLVRAFALQSAVMAVLGLTVTWQMLRPASPPEYGTLAAPAATATAAARLQIVFADDATAGEMRGLLDRVGGRIVSGPSRAGVFLVALREGAPTPDAAERDVQAAVAVLGAEPAVRYVATIPPVTVP